jgi:hypothetical protein
LQNIINVTIHSSKNYQCGKKRNFANSKSIEKNLCPFQNIELYLKVRPTIKGPLFIHLNHRGVTPYQACSILKSALRCAWYNLGQYNTHSFIIGAATTAVMLGKTADQIKHLSKIH